MMHVREHLEKTYPGRARKARGNERAEAIRMFCLECMGASPKEVERCTDKTCWLYQFRLPRSVEVRMLSGHAGAGAVAQEGA